MPKLRQEPAAPDLEIPHDLAYQKWKWSVERVCWVLMSLAIVAALRRRRKAQAK